MRTKHIIIALSVSSIFFSCNWDQAQENGQQSLMEISKQELAMALQERDQLLALVKEVSAGLEQIRQIDKTIMSAYPKGNADQNVQILADISSLKETLQKRKGQLQEMEAKLQNSTINNKELQETIEALRFQIDAQIEETDSFRHLLTAANRQIGVLSNTVDSLNTTVSTVTEERDVAQKTSVQFENELNRCYYIVAARSELKAHGIVESGFFRKAKLLEGNFDKEYFMTSDKRELETLTLDATKVKILTKHPERSYELVDEDGVKSIRITDPDLFWSLANHLVVQVN